MTAPSQRAVERAQAVVREARKHYAMPDADAAWVDWSGVEFLIARALDATPPPPAEVEAVLEKWALTRVVSSKDMADLLATVTALVDEQHVRTRELSAKIVDGSIVYEISDSAVNLAVLCGITQVLATRIRQAPRP